jgi:peptidoglycan hydrolase-like protein with peptidoglycan-binding domain
MPSLPRLRRSLAVLVVAALGATLGLTASSSTAEATNPPTPGNVVAKGFDQCEAPSQASMSAWRASSPYVAAGIYISGAKRFCQAQTNLTPTWVATQLAAGWRLLPIHLGRQASCSTRDRYQDYKISADATNGYATAQAQGAYEADVAANAAAALGIVSGSVLFYDLEAFPMTDAGCRASSLWFLHGWTNRVHARGYLSGVYSSAASGMNVLDDARVTPGNPVALPDAIWIADWNGVADANSSYIRSDGWSGRRVHQYKGGHTETWGGVTINIDSNYLDLRNLPGAAPAPKPAGVTCTDAGINKPAYRVTAPGLRTSLIAPLQCLLKQRGLYTATVTGAWNRATRVAVNAFQRRVRHKVANAFSRSDWTALLAAGHGPSTLRVGSRGADVVRLQRSLNAAIAWFLPVNGVYDARTRDAVKRYQRNVGIRRTGVVATQTWAALSRGRR